MSIVVMTSQDALDAVYAAVRQAILFDLDPDDDIMPVVDRAIEAL